MPTVDPLAQYPNVAALQKVTGKGPGAVKRFCEYGASWLPRLDAALSALDMRSRASLRGLAADLFSDDDGKLFAAVHEILAFDWLKQEELLAESEIGFPFDWRGDDPPFEGVLNLPGRPIPFDVKDGSGDGRRLLESIFEKEVKATAKRLGIEPCEVHVALDAPSGQKWMQNNFASLVRPFRADLASNGLSPRIITLKAGSGAVRVGIDRGGLLAVLANEEHDVEETVDGVLGADVIGSEEKAAFVAEQMFDHAVDKAGRLALTTAREFCLIYVKRPDSGHTDFDSHTVATACRFLASRSALPTEFVGLLFVDMETDGNQTTTLWDRYGALPQKMRALADDILQVSPKASLEERRAKARRLASADLEPTSCVLAGSCDLRDKDCTADGTTSAVFVYFGGGEQLLACQNCRTKAGWPSPGDR